MLCRPRDEGTMKVEVVYACRKVLDQHRTHATDLTTADSEAQKTYQHERINMKHRSDHSAIHCSHRCCTRTKHCLYHPTNVLLHAPLRNFYFLSTWHPPAEWELPLTFRSGHWRAGLERCGGGQARNTTVAVFASHRIAAATFFFWDRRRRRRRSTTSNDKRSARR